MKWFTLLIFKSYIPIGLRFSGAVFGQSADKDICVQLGIYNFTEDLAHEFYKSVPPLHVGVDFYKRKQVAFSACTGIRIPIKRRA